MGFIIQLLSVLVGGYLWRLFSSQSILELLLLYVLSSFSRFLDQKRRYPSSAHIRQNHLSLISTLAATRHAKSYLRVGSETDNRLRTDPLVLF